MYYTTMKLSPITLNKYFESMTFLHNKLTLIYNIEFEYYLTI